MIKNITDVSSPLFLHIHLNYFYVCIFNVLVLLIFPHLLLLKVASDEIEISIKDVLGSIATFQEKLKV